MNGWHWEERNMMGWSRDKLTELLVGLVADISPEQGAAQLTELKDLKGEVSVGATCLQTGLVGLISLQVRVRKGLYGSSSVSPGSLHCSLALPAKVALANCPAAHLTHLKDSAFKARCACGYC